MSSRAHKKPVYQSLYFQVIIAIAIGVLLGYFFPETGEAMKPLGDGFIKLIKMIIAPVIFCTVVVGIAGMESMKTVGKTGGYALLYFEAVSTLALIVGLVIINTFQPGAGMNIDPASLDTKSVAQYAAPGKMQSTTEFLLNAIPNTVVDAFAKGEILQVLLFSVLFGFALHAFGAKGKPVFELIDKLSHVLFGIVGIIMKVAPLGAFGAMAFTIGKYGVGSLLSLARLIGSGFIRLAARQSARGGVPVAGLGLILGIDRFMSEARALTNLIGNGVATVVVGRWCREVDVERMRRHLDQETAEEAEAPEKVLVEEEEGSKLAPAALHR